MDWIYSIFDNRIPCFDTRNLRPAIGRYICASLLFFSSSCGCGRGKKDKAHTHYVRTSMVSSLSPCCLIASSCISDFGKKGLSVYGFMSYSRSPGVLLFFCSHDFLFCFILLLQYIKNILRTSAVSSANFGSILIFASCVVGTCNVL